MLRELTQIEVENGLTGELRSIELPAGVEIAVPVARQHGFRTLARDIFTMGMGTALAAAFNAALVFLIPRIVSVEDFGYWRLFMLYGSYAGLLQMGLLDGALLRWAGQPAEAFQSQIRVSLKFLAWQIAMVVGPGAILVWCFLNAQFRFIGMSVLIFAALFNLSALLQYSLQSAREFRPVAIASAAPAGIFVVLAFLSNLKRVPDFRILIALYCTAWAGAFCYLWIRVRPLKGPRSPETMWSLGKGFVLVGWPIVLANIGLGFVQSADRLVVSWMLPLHQFAQYSLATSAMFVPITAIAAIYRVFFSHAAALQHEGRAKVYAHASRFLLLAWSILIPYFFILEIIVRRFLPKYTEVLPAAGILLLGVFFIAEIQILHTSFAYIYGKQRQFLILTVVALVLAFAIGIGVSLWRGTLIAIAAGQLVAFAVWWAANEWALKAETGRSWTNQLVSLAIFAWSTISYGIAIRYSVHLGVRILTYYALVAVFLSIACSNEIRILRSWLTPDRLHAAG